MSQSTNVYTGATRSDARDEESVITDGSVVHDVLIVLNSDDCREILELTTAEPRSVREIAEAGDLPLSTAYYKVNLLTDAGFLRETVRLSSTGNHVSEYARAVDDVVVSVAADGTLELVVRRTTPDDRTRVDASRRWR